MPAVYFFLIDVSMNAIQTGATAAACSAISQVISDLPVSSLVVKEHIFLFCLICLAAYVYMHSCVVFCCMLNMHSL